VKYVFFVYEPYPYPIIGHLIDEGQNVTVGIVKFMRQLNLPDVPDEESEEDRQRRMSVYDGLTEKKTAEQVISELARVPQSEKDDYFIFFDFNNMFNISERVLRLGFRNGLFPTKTYYELEKDREMAKKFVSRNYRGIEVADARTFKTTKEGMDFLKRTDEVYVLKSNGNSAPTMVPKTDDPEEAKQQVIEQLKKYSAGYEQGGYMLEQKISDAVEVTPVLVFYDGEPIYSLAEFECKNFGAGDIGVQKGGNLALSVRTPLNCKLNRRAFPRVVYDMAKKQPGLAVFDIGLMFDGKDFYFTEFCGMRYGWDGIFSEIVMRDTGSPFVNDYFQDLKNKESPIRNKFGASVRLFSVSTGTGEDTELPPSGIAVKSTGERKNNLFLYRVKKASDGVVTVAGWDFVGCATGAGETMQEAADNAYKTVKTVEFDRLYYRPEFDFLSDAYSSSIPNRYAKLKRYLK
jgi:phosphoribosylamine-glycine ligase